MSANEHIEYATVTTGLRAPRVAVVFPAQANWDYFARAAMYAASNTWGGAGFVLVPATDGNVDPHVRDAVVAYDPDYVVSYSYTVGDLDKLTPGTIEKMLDEQNIDDQESRSRLRDDLRSMNVDDDVLARTRDAVVEASSSYRMDNSSEPGDDYRWHERELSLSAPVPTGPGSHLGALTPIEKIRRPADPTPVSVSPTLTGDIGVAAVMRLGLLSAPTAEGQTLDQTQRSAVQRWLLGVPTRFPSATPQAVLDPDYGTARGLPSVWDATTLGLASVTSVSSRRNRKLCVIGSTANDFALAMIWDRLYGNGLWIPDSWIGGEDRAHILQLLRDTLTPFYAREERAWAVTSVSHDIDAVAKVRDDVIGSPSTFMVSDPKTADAANDLPVIGLDDDLHFPDRGKLHFGIDEQFSSTTTMPVLRDPDGSTTLAATPALPIVQHELLRTVPDLSWQVDIDVPDTPIPPSRHVPAHVILHPDESPHNTWMRVGRAGLSYEALAYGFVPAGASADYRLVKPRVRRPSMQAWATARASLTGRTVATSAAGRHGDVLQTMFGSRNRLIEAISGDLLPVFRSFIPQFKTTREQFPEDEGCLVRGTVAYLNFSGVVSISGLPIEEARAQCDELLTERILSRGLLLNCSACGNLDFVVIDRLRQVNECLRCGHPNDLSLSRWKMPTGEPQWFYDLHPVATALMAQNGDVPILLAAHLRATASQSNRYADCAELEVSDSTGNKLAEADLLALVDDRVVVAEAKSTDQLDKGSNQRKAAKKRVLLAETFGAEEIVLATTRDGWTTASLNAMRAAVKGHDWKTMRRPRIREVLGLGTKTVKDRYVDVD
ncbi:hypothetical protein OCS65_28625 (plasmid) [Rhodococcus aetherivorans]|uniref:Uncharacterized protein n=1 Tax=Rhodococcus aetherivorans TaxID=191292 RepID=A0AA46P595_9NOCA|nr:hypothetical protein [Rhodococcus aetherivorans]MDV6297425.1 hypothetical protein [Rhodococcus aetherivorans]UYF97228.1 hypothetical protein OCS65_28625 [Rhodococcus aetherivorans]